MSGQSGIDLVDQILRNIDVADIQDERARECIRLLLNLIESLTADLRKAQAENLYLREQLNRRKCGGDKPSRPKDSAGTKLQSSEKERAETKQRVRRGKLDRVRIDREEVLKLDRASLPPDAQFKGYEDVVVQELRIGTDNVKFRKEKYYAPSTGQTYLAPLPAGYRGEFGPNLKSLCLLFSHLCNMTEPKIADLLDNFGIAISSGQISAWLTGAYPGIQEEKRAIVEAGLASSPWQHMDDTGTRVDGENQHCQILCNPLYGAYFTTAHKDRLSIIDVLRNGRQRVFRLNEEALDLVVVQRGHKRLHRLVRIGVHPREPPTQQPEVAEFRDRHLAQCCLVGHRRRQRRIFGEPEESDQFRIGEQAEQVQKTVGGSDRMIAGPWARRRAAFSRTVSHERSLTTCAPQGGPPAGLTALVHYAKKLRRECGTSLAAFTLAVRRGVCPVCSAAMGSPRERATVSFCGVLLRRRALSCWWSARARPGW